MTSFENLDKFFDRIKSIGFWQRIFYWGEIKRLSYDAYEEFKSFISSIHTISNELDQTKQTCNDLTKDNQHLESTLNEARINSGKLENKISSLEDEIKRLNNKRSELQNKIIKFEQIEETRKDEYEKNVTKLNTIQQGLKDERQKLSDDRLREKEEEFEKMKKTWTEHENNIKNRIKAICNNHVIEYVENVPFKGIPDNTIQICDEFIIFDAKSPASDNLDNFQNYIKVQTESVKKYIKQESVKKDIFLVIPSNTVDVIKQFTFNMGDYNVYIITADALEPIIISLKKIEEYEFAEQLSPEERDNICRVIGRFAHTTKRKIQIDHFFTNEFLEILTRCKNDLPSDFLEKVIEFELADKLNPPMEKRAKQILTKELRERSKAIQQEAEAKGIVAPAADEIKKLPLYKDESQ